MSTIGLGRVAVVDSREGAPRVLRPVRELVRAGQATAAVAVFAPRDRLARFVREADEAVELQGSLEDALRAARADSAWVGEASRAALTESPPPGLTPEEETAARELALRACAADGWVGLCAVQHTFDPRTRRWTLRGVEPFAQSAAAVEMMAAVDLVRLALQLAAGAPRGG